MSAAVSPERILKELGELWISLARAEQSEGATVVRACSMTLIAATGATGEESPAGEVIASLMREHPSRAIVLRVAPDDPGRLESRVFAQCWRPHGGRQQICCEQVEITASRDMLGDVAALLSGILAPDLPVVVWCRESSLLLTPEFRPILPLAHKLIFDSSGFADQHEVLRGLPDLGRTGCVLADLNWTRVTRWRQAVAEAFDSPARRAKVKDLEELSICYRTPEIPPGAWYLWAWVEHALGRSIRVRFRHACEGPGLAIQEIALSGPGITVSVARTEGDAVQLRRDSLSSGVVFPPQPEYGLVGEELSLLEADPLYDIVLERACALAQSNRGGDP